MLNVSKSPNSFSPREISDTIKNNFTFCWYEFYKFIFSYYFRWRKELGDLETLCIGILIISNASSNKDLIIQDIDIESWREKISYADKIGLNSMSISDITGIPRPTVVRKVNFLIKKGYAKVDQKKLISINIEKKVFSKTQKMQEQTIKEISELIYKILNKKTIS